MKKKYPLFTSQQLATATGTSRSKILRIEDTGLIYPDNRDGSAYARHYDIYTALKLFRILNYHNLGFTKAETVKHFDKNEDYSEAIAVLENRIKVMSDVLYSLKVRTGKEMHNVIRRENDSAAYYYVRRIGSFENLESCFEEILTALSEAMLAGYRIRYERAMSVRIDFDAGGDTYICIPVDNSSTGEKTVLFPETEKVFTTWFGRLDDAGSIYDSLSVYAESHGLKYSKSLVIDILTMPSEKEKFSSEESVLKISIAVNE